MVSETYQSKNVCVIGAGPSGLVVARELRKEGHKVVVLEQNHDIGGQWLYDPNVEGEDPLGRNPFLKVHSSIYESLRLMSPREVMGFTDFPFLSKKGRDMRRFPSHRELFLYLSDFCEWFGLRDLIRFNTRVEYVGPMNFGACSNDLRWVVRSKRRRVGKWWKKCMKQLLWPLAITLYLDCPALKVGMDTWKRKQMHSHIYRTPEPFSKEIVVIVGNSYSGQEISIELVKVAKEVHLSSKSLDITEGLSNSYPNMRTITFIHRYSYSFPFLDTKGTVVVDDNRVGPLYEHTFPPSLAPSLSLIGIPRKVDGIPKRYTHDIETLMIPKVRIMRKELCLSSVFNSFVNLDTFRDSWENDELLQEALQSPYFTQLEGVKQLDEDSL
ncbi:Flavin monooxygenase FMO [Sesbania bispinosa]|nr:Flavin monooxygenase FMO [Sesbania bispinosa]